MKALDVSLEKRGSTGDSTVEVTYTYNTMEINLEIVPALFEEEMPANR